MKPWILVALALAACGDDNSTAQPDAPAPDAPSVDAAPGTALLRIHYDTGVGHRIALRGDGPDMSWTAGQDCTWTTGNIWECAVDNVAQTFEAKPLFDDVTFARGSNWRVGSGATLDIYPNFTGTTGRIVTIPDVHSQFLANDRDVAVYLPPSYDENAAKRYPVVIMHDGQNLYDPALAFGNVAWEIDAAMNDLVASTGIEEAIVVGVNNTAARIDEYTPTADASVGGGGAAPMYMRFLIEELRPMIDAAYRTDAGRLALAGSSLGGLASLFGCWDHPDVFDRCGVFSPSLWWDDKELATRIAADPATATTKPLAIYIDSGDSGPSNDGMTDTAAMRDTLAAKGFVLGENLQYVLGAGDSHDETAWAARAPAALRWLLHDADRVP